MSCTETGTIEDVVDSVAEELLARNNNSIAALTKLGISGLRPPHGFNITWILLVQALVNVPLNFSGSLSK